MNFYRESKNNCSIMQPCVFPYIGYFHLIQGSDLFVFYDDVNHIKRGWINRNRILLNGVDYLFTIPLQKASQNKFINETQIETNYQKKLLTQLRHAYINAPYYQQVFALVESVLLKPHKYISELGIDSIVSVYKYLNLDFRWGCSSSESSTTRNLGRAERLIAITKQFNYNTYINLSGGKKLYDKHFFSQRELDLKFVYSTMVEYNQNQKEFIPSLSIIDVLMFNSIENVKEHFSLFTLT